MQNKAPDEQPFNARIILRVGTDDTGDSILPDIFIKVVNISDTDFPIMDVNGLFYGLISISTESARHVLINKRLKETLVRGIPHRVTTIAPGEYMLYQARIYEYVMHESPPDVNPHAWWRDVLNEKEVLIHVEAFEKAIMPAEMVVLRKKDEVE